MRCGRCLVFILLTITTILILYVTCFRGVTRNGIQTPNHLFDQEVKEDFYIIHREERGENDAIDNLKSFPWFFYKEGARKPKGIRKNCGDFPSIADIKFNNIFWQKSVFDGVEFYILGAYFDERPKKSAVIRLLIMANSLNLQVKTKCQLWYDTKGVSANSSWATYIWKENWGYQSDSLYQPFLISCAVPENFQNEIPLSVSLVGENECETATNNLYINYHSGNRTKFGVCVKGLSFHEDISVKLTEWLELLQLLGASKVYIYNFDVPEKISRLLDYYRKERNFVEVTPTSLPGKYPNAPYLQYVYLRKYLGVKRLVEVAQYNDCFYKNKNKHDYIVILDVDEVIIPREGDWNTLLSSIREMGDKTRASYYYVNNYYFFENNLNEPKIPSYMNILKNTYRTKGPVNQNLYVKSFYDTRDVLTVHNHLPLRCMTESGDCKPFEIEPNLAKLHHYRKTCVNDIDKTECERMKKKLVEDRSVWRFKERLIERVNRTIKDLGLL